MNARKSKIKWWVIITRVMGASLLIFGVWMFNNDVEYASTFDGYHNGVQKEQMTVEFTYVKAFIIGLVLFFFREILKYLDYVKYG